MWHHKRHQISLNELKDVRYSKVHDIKQNRMPKGGPSSHVRSLSHSQYADCDAASVHDPTYCAIGPCERSSSSLASPEDSPKNIHGHDSFYRLGGNSTGVALHEITPESHQSFRGFKIKYNHQNQGITRIHSRSPPGTRRRSFGPGTTNRRNGVIAFPNFDSTFNGHQLLTIKTGDIDRLEKSVTDGGSRSRPGSMVTQADPNPVHYNQVVRNTFEISPSSPGVTSVRERNIYLFDYPTTETQYNLENDVSSSSQSSLDYQHGTDRSGMDNHESSPNTDIANNNKILPIGKWRCCECRRGHEIYRYEAAQHLISVLNCLCKHRSCTSCTFQGNIRSFAPIYDIEGVALIPVFEGNGKPTRFGVICHTCGLSWRAEKLREPKRHRFLRKKLSYLPKKINPLRKLRHTQSMINLSFSPGPRPEESRPGSAMSTFRSTFNLVSASDTQAKGAKPEEQAEGAQVRFYGIVCTCGTITDSSSVCFQVVDTSDVNIGTVSKEQTTVEATETAQSQCTQELQSKGYGTSTLYLKGGVHPNPLLSNPVQGSSPL